MYLFSGLQLFAFVTYLYLGIYILAINPRERLNHACASAIACMAIWSLEYMVVYFPTTSYQTARLWLNLGALGWIGMWPALLWFTHLFTGHGRKVRTLWYHVLTTVPSLVFIIAQWSMKIVDDLHPKLDGGWTFSYSHSYWTVLFCIYYAAMVSWCLFLLQRFSRKARRRSLKAAARMLFGITFCCLVLGSITDTILPIFGKTAFPPVAPLVIMIWAAGLTYTLFKYKFLTITPATAAPNILATMSDLLILCDPHGKIVTINPAGCQLLGRPAEELEGRLFMHSIANTNPSEKVRFWQAFGRQTMENRRLHLITSKGVDVPVMLSCSRLRDNNGELAGTVIVAKDITESNKAEIALKSSQARYRDLVENINDVMYTLDARGLITYVSPRVQSVLGFSPEELTGRHIHDLLYKEEQKKADARVEEVLQGESGASKYRLKRKDGSTVWIRTSGRPIKKNKAIVGMRGVLTDISKQVATMEEMQQLEARLHRAQKMEAIGTLAGGVAHDLNNILSGVVSYPELLLTDLPVDHKLRKPLELIKKSGEKAATIVQDLLTLARRSVPNFEVINLNHIISEFMESPELRKQQSFYPEVRVELHVDENLNNITGSGVHLAHTVMNLTANAFEATSGKATITIETKNQVVDSALAMIHGVAPGDYCLLTVTDDGMGIEPEDLDRIFEPFYTKKVMGRSGTGLGMAVVWGTVLDHHGFIEVSSQPGHGARFEIYLPSTREIVLDQIGPLPRAAYMGRNETILVIDDVEEQRTIATAILSELDYVVQSASSGEEALSMVRDHPVDLIILDMIMAPGMDGLDTYKAILAIHPRQKAIIASGFSETKRVKKALDLGAAQYIKKPYALENIGVAVRTVLDSPHKPMDGST